AAAAEPEQHVRAVDVRELGPLGQLASDLQDLDRLARRAKLLERPALARERAHVELSRPERGDLPAHLPEEVDGLVVTMRLREGLGLGELRLDPGADVRRDAAQEVLRVDAEPLREPRDR